MSDTTTPPAAVAPGALGRTLKIALFLSVALNLLVIGAVVGTMYGLHRGGPGRHFGGGADDFGVSSIVRLLPEARRKEIRKELSANRIKLRPMIDEIRALRRAAADQLAADPFDRAALQAAIDKVAEKERALRQTAVGMFMDRAAALSTDERHLLADAWRRKSEEHRRRRRHMDDKDAKDEGAEESQQPAASQPPGPPSAAPSAAPQAPSPSP